MAHIVDDSRASLEGFFSAPIAKAILGAAMKRAGTTGPEFQPAWYDAFFAELTRLLSVYLPDPARRAHCMTQLDALRAVVRPKAVASTPNLRAPRVPLFDGVPGAVHETPLEVDPNPFASASRRQQAREARRDEDTNRALPMAESAGAHRLSARDPGTTTKVLVRDEIDVPNACEVARDLSKKLGFSVVDQTKMATAVSELARNMLQYAGGGTILFAEVLAPRRGLEAFFEDRGPGIANLEGVLDPKYRSTTGMGMGLRGSKRIADEFLIDTQPGDGTRITMRKYVA